MQSLLRLRRTYPVLQLSSNVGASLLAKAMYQSTGRLNDTPLSRAGSLPQVVRGITRESSHPCS
ncbi:hypothetical protein FGE05_16470 [Pseudomonas sp. ICMP22404]|nr:hypothetical protein FGE05_16470 [Pseudomonas sp. ICMP22404]